MTGSLKALVLLTVSVLPTEGLWADGAEQRWQLRISGHHSFVFGEGGLGGGVRIPWEVAIDFQVGDGEYLVGSGSARWLERVLPLSQPADCFRCSRVDGSYLDSNLALHETPRVRFSGFPVAGSLRDGRVRLQPAYTSPGNYLAVTYECTTDNPIAENWFALAERDKQVLGKRQDAETRRDGAFQMARVREVASLPPVTQLELPLEDGWTFSQGAGDGASLADYVLRRLH